MDGEPVERTGRAVLGCLAAIVAVALMLRLIGLGWGLPGDVDVGGAYYHPSYLGDETSWVMNIYYAWVGQRKLYDNASVHLGHGPGAEYINTFALGVAVLTGYLERPSTERTDFQATRKSYHKDQQAMRRIYLAPRLCAALFGVLGVALVFLITRRISDERAGLWAAATLAVCPLHVVFSHFARSDGYSTFFVALTLLMAQRVYVAGRLRDYLMAGLVAGLMTGTKYPTCMFGLSILVAHLLRGKEVQPVSHVRLLYAFVTTLVGFVLFVPAAVLEPNGQRRSFLWWLAENYKQIADPSHWNDLRIDWWIGYGHEGVYRGLFGYGFPSVLTWTLYALGILAIAWVTVTALLRRRQWLIVVIPSLAYLLFSLRSTWLLVRWMDMMMPFLAISVGLFVAHRRTGALGRIAPVLAAAALTHAFAFSLAYACGMSRPDTRSLTALWLEKNGVPGYTVGMIKPQLQPTQTRLNWDKFKHAEIFLDPQKLAALRPEYYVLHHGDYRQFDLYPSSRRELPAAWEFVRALREEREYKEVKRLTNEARLGPLTFPVGLLDVWDWPFQTVHIYQRKDLLDPAAAPPGR